MEFCSVNSTNHLIVPVGYNRVFRQVKPLTSVHSAKTQAEIHNIALQFTSTILYIPQIYGIYKDGYETECIYHTKDDRYNPLMTQMLPEIFVELFRFKEFMMTEGYFMRDISLCKNSANRWALLDFSKFGHIANRMVKFPKDPYFYSLDRAEMDYGLQVSRLLEAKTDDDPYNGLYD